MAGLRLSADGFEPVVLRLDRFRQNLENTESVFQEIAEYQKTVVNARVFNEQAGPDTGRWAALSPRYEAYKNRVRPGRPILVFDGDLKEAMTTMSAGVTEVGHNFATTGAASDIAFYHQHGTTYMPARPIIGRAQKIDERAIAKMLQRFIIEGTA